VPVIPLLGIGFSVWLGTKLQPVTWLRFIAWFIMAR